MLHQSDELSTLMRAANGGDSAAYRKVLAKLTVCLRAFIRRGLAAINRGQEDTEDIVQETLLAIHLKRHTWDECQPLEPWVRAIARHKLIDGLRRRGFREHVDISDYADVLVAPSELEGGARHDWEILMASLTPSQRRIIKGVSIEGRSAHEVGESLGMSEGAVRVALHRALKALAAAYRRNAQ